MTTVISPHRLAALLGDDLAQESGPLYRTLADRMRLLVSDGRVPDGVRLPSERELAGALRLSRTTTTRAYAELRDAGLIESRRGSGSVVHVPLGLTGASSLIIDPDDENTVALTYAAPAGPPGLAQAFEKATERSASLFRTTGYLPDGLPALREALAERYRSRGLPTDPGQIIVTAGAMGALSLLARTIISPGRRVVVEAASYPHAHDSFVAAGGRLAPLPAGETPWDVDAATALFAGARHHLAYLIPEFHNPTGVVMDAEQRGHWAHLMRRHDVLPVIDESLREVNLDGVDLPPSLAHHDDRAVLVGSASKEFWGGLRVGWIRAPHELVTAIVQHRMTDDLGSSAFEQLVVTELLTEGGQTAAAGRARSRAARDHLLGELAEQLPEISVRCPAGGLNLWAELPRPTSSRLVTAAVRHGLLLTPGPRFYTSGPTSLGERRLRLPYTQEPAALDEAVRRLRAAWDDVEGTGRSTAPADPGRTLDLIA
ncbi:PLP-dependent aminotransferase family protein [Aeromicrobium sp. CTD01-1L150]|uniref:MocR-like transcription factor YczR n=1 Tax=Aeromicrobium sp. CTD01-1L150 TaxID=3341830 RepID=UPI0035C13FD9